MLLFVYIWSTLNIYWFIGIRNCCQRIQMNSYSVTFDYSQYLVQHSMNNPEGKKKNYLPLLRIYYHHYSSYSGRNHNTSFSSKLTNEPNKLERLPLASLSILEISNTPEAAFTTLHSLCNLRMLPIGLSVRHWKAFFEYCNVTLWLIEVIRKLRIIRKWLIVNDS